MGVRWLLSRTDRLGDLLLTLPMGNFIRTHLPEVEPTFLVSKYAAPIVAHHDPPFPYVLWEEQKHLTGYDVLIHVYPRASIAWAGWRGGIPRRIGTSRRWYHWLTCTDLPRVSRRHSGRHEAHLNLLLLSPLLSPAMREYLHALSWEKLLTYRARLKPTHSLPETIERRLSAFPQQIVLHVGSGGGAPIWQHWATLATRLIHTYPHALLIFTGTASEKKLITPILGRLPVERLWDMTGSLSLPQLITLLSQANLVIAGSTGPLHIAAALDTPAIGIYPATAAMGPWRWKPLSPYAVALGGATVCRKCTSPCRCLNTISPEEVIETALSLLTLQKSNSISSSA